MVDIKTFCQELLKTNLTDFVVIFTECPYKGNKYSDILRSINFKHFGNYIKKKKD